MNIPYEFSKVRESFVKVKKDMKFLSEKITKNYEEYLKSHKELSAQLVELSKHLGDKISGAREVLSKGAHDEKMKDEIALLKHEVRELKQEISHTLKHNNDLVKTHEDLRSPSKEVGELRKKLESSELEIFLLKERMLEKDVEIKQIKEISNHLFGVVDELSKLELELISNRKK